MNINEMNLDQLKILHFDTTLVFNKAQQNLKVINQQISNKLKEKKMFQDEETPVDAGSDAAAEETPTTEETPAEETPSEETPAEEVAQPEEEPAV